MSSRRLLAVVIFVILAVAVGTILFAFNPVSKPMTLRIFNAGSLTIPLKDVKELFERENPGVDVVVEPSGSVLAVRKITELNKVADVLAVADYRLIPDLMIPDHADFYIAFASNRIVLAYTDKSRYSDEISSENWFRILMRDDVRYGFSNPNDDPCGYRALMVLALAEKWYGINGLFERLVTDKSNIEAIEKGEDYMIHVPIDLKPDSGSNLVIRSKSVDLIALLEGGALDYAFEYRSVAIQHGLRYVELPPEIDLSDPRFDEEYGKIHVYLFYGTDKQKEVVGKSIVYGLTIPRCAENRDLAIKFINLLLSDEGRKIFEENGQSFLDRIIAYGNVPEEIKLG